ncbi:MAG: lysine exporter LysO family protein [Tissierellia bacterium]|nr:lysine exporter LysO family protein [Tissierellia bacterium]
MVITLIKYLGILVIGGIIGYKDKLSPKLEGKLNTIQSACLLFLLFVMGITIGLNDEVISNIFSIGLKAGLISVFTVGFSILFVYLVRKFVLMGEKEIES